MDSIVFNAIWLLGLLIIVITISYCEFLAYLYEKKRSAVYLKKERRASIILGSILIVMGTVFTSLARPSDAQSGTPKEYIQIEEPVSFPPNKLFRRDAEFTLPAWMNRRIILRSEFISFEKSDYEIRITTKGKQALGEYPKVLLLIGYENVAEFFTAKKIKENVFEFKSKSQRPRRLILDFVNNHYQLRRAVDRRLYIQSIVIKRVDKKPQSLYTILRRNWLRTLMGIFILSTFFWLTLQKPRWEKKLDQVNDYAKKP